MRRTRHISRVYWLRNKLFFIILFIILFFGFGYWFVFVSPHFQIREIIIQGFNQSLAQKTELFLRQNNTRFVPFLIYGIFPQYLYNNKSYLSFYFSDLENSLLKQHPKIENIDAELDIKKGILVLNIRQRKIDFLWCFQDDDCYYLDKNGVIFEKAISPSGSFIKKIVFLETEKIFLGNQVISPDKLEALDKIFILTQRQESPISIDFLEIKIENFSDVKLVTNEGFYLLYNLDDDFSGILKIITEMKKQKFNDSFSRLKYIDCRYLPKVYYKEKL